MYGFVHAELGLSRYYCICVKVCVCVCICACVCVCTGVMEYE